jgi:hypothetical protein
MIFGFGCVDKWFGKLIVGVFFLYLGLPISEKLWEIVLVLLGSVALIWGIVQGISGLF